jgi:hypothetical protein
MSNEQQNGDFNEYQIMHFERRMGGLKPRVLLSFVHDTPNPLKVGMAQALHVRQHAIRFSELQNSGAGQPGCLA